jgi:hypothetical protein
MVRGGPGLKESYEPGAIEVDVDREWRMMSFDPAADCILGRFLKGVSFVG